MPASYKRATAPLDAMARARLSSSTPAPPSLLSSPDNSPELADLVDSFYDHDDEPKSESQCSSTENGSLGRYRLCKKKMAKMIAESSCDSAAQRVASAAGLVESKRELVARLRDKDFDAGICITSWTQTRRLTAGTYEYVDAILADRSRYIVAVDLAKEFDIVRPTSHYQSILRSLPELLVVKAEILKKVVKILCAMAKESIRSNGMHIPPWRSWAYVEAKWFSPYTRLENGETVKRTAGKGEVGAGAKYPPMPGVLQD